MKGRVREILFMYGERSMTAEITILAYGLAGPGSVQEFVEAYQSGCEVDIQVSGVGIAHAGTAVE